MKRYTQLCFIAMTSMALVVNNQVQAQMVGPNAYIQGVGVEIGIDGTYGFEGADQTVSPAPAGMHFRSGGTNYFGFVANPQNNLWATYDGDFFSPGSPENGWGFELDTIKRDNNCVNGGWGGNGISGAITSWTYIAPEYSVDWEGDYISAGTNLHFKINYNLQETDLFYTTTVSITNNTTDTIPQLYYYRNVDPDNNVSINGGDFSTTNTIVSQPFGGGTYAHVSAASTNPWSSYFAFLTDADPNWRASFGGFSNRDASDLWEWTNASTYFPAIEQTVGAAIFNDDAMSISYKIQNLIPAGTETFKFCSVFDPGSTECAQAAMRMSHAAIPSVTTITPAFVLSGGSPAGGTYTGTGVIGGTTFDPSISGAGDFPLLYAYTDTNSCTSYANVTVHVDVAMGVEESETVNTVVYPNPVTDEATISVANSAKLDNAQLRVFDVLGKEVKTISNISSNSIKIDRAGLSQGMYFYKLYNNSKEISSGKILLK